MNAAVEAPLVFNWGPPRRRARALVVFIALSLLLHALCFYVFQIVYPPTVLLLPPPARVNFISSSSEEGRALLRQIDAEDPALTSATQRPPESKSRALPKLQHVPSYINRQAPLKELPPLLVDLRPPSAQPPAPAPMTNRETPSTAMTAATSVVFSEEIADLGAAKFPATKFTASTAEQPDNVRFRIAVNARGEVRYCFPINSSGDASLSAQARQHIALTRFPARSTLSNDSLTWGIATVQWGNDVAVPPARSTSPAAPSP